MFAEFLVVSFLLRPKSGGGQLLVVWRQLASWRSHMQVSQEHTLLSSVSSRELELELELEQSSQIREPFSRDFQSYATRIGWGRLQSSD